MSPLDKVKGRLCERSRCRLPWSSWIGGEQVVKGLEVRVASLVEKRMGPVEKERLGPALEFGLGPHL